MGWPTGFQSSSALQDDPCVESLGAFGVWLQGESQSLSLQPQMHTPSDPLFLVTEAAGKMQVVLQQAGRAGHHCLGSPEGLRPLDTGLYPALLHFRRGGQCLSILSVCSVHPLLCPSTPPAGFYCSLSTHSCPAPQVPTNPVTPVPWVKWPDLRPQGAANLGAESSAAFLQRLSS